MELFKRTIEILDANLINCLIPIILTLLFTELIFKKRFETRKVLTLTRWTIIGYALITWISYGVESIQNYDNSTFVGRATVHYAFAYWLMLSCSLILPFTLLIEKLAFNFWYMILVAFGLKIGAFFEYFAIIVANLHRDFIPTNANSLALDEFAINIGLIFIQGIIIAAFALAIFKLSKRETAHSNRN
ncbi:MAG: hypothetical protein NWR83_09630 [Salibacteraceae bacterium]|nr:hypothetical protein [Salibacteraceae bacterium]